MSHLTEAEIQALHLSELHRRTPFVIGSVSFGMLSPMRHYGGGKFNGESYVYVPSTDELIRADVVKWLAKLRKSAKKSPPEASAPLPRTSQPLT